MATLAVPVTTPAVVALSPAERRALISACVPEVGDLMDRQKRAQRDGRTEDAIAFGRDLAALESALAKLGMELEKGQAT